MEIDKQALEYDLYAAVSDLDRITGMCHRTYFDMHEYDLAMKDIDSAISSSRSSIQLVMDQLRNG